MKQSFKKTLPGIFTGAFFLLTLHMQAQVQIINTFAGNGTQTYTGDGGPSVIAGLNYPFAVCVDDSGNVYITDTFNDCIRKVNAYTDVITTVAGNGTKGYSGDGKLATQAQLNEPEGIAVDTAGNLYISDTYNNVIRKVTKSTGIITTIAGGGSNPGTDGVGDGGPATGASFATPIGVAVDDTGNVYIVDHYNGRIRKVTVATGIIQSIAGAGSNPGTDGVGDGGPATGASFNQPDGIAIDDSNNVYIADQWHSRIRKFIARNDSIISIAGTNVFGYHGDGGLADTAQLDICSGVAVDHAGNVYIADSYNNEIRKVTKSTGIITTIAGYISAPYQGTGNGTYSGDGGPATLAQLNQPYGVAVDACGNVYSAETNSGGQYDNRIRIIYIPDSVKASPNPVSICNGNSAAITASGANTYTWSPSAGLSDSTGITVTANPTVSTTYTLTGSIGCAGGVTMVPTMVVVTVGTASTLTFTPPSATVCNGQNIALSVNGGGTNFTWSPSAGLNKTAGDTVIAAPTVNTTYTVTENSGGNCNSTGTIAVTVGSALPLDIEPQGKTLCKGQDVELIATGGTNLTWSPSTGLNKTIGDTVIALPDTTVSYTVTGTDSAGCSATGTDVLTVIAAPIAVFTDTIKTNGLVVFNSAGSTGATTYSWNFGDQSALSSQVNPSHAYNTSGVDSFNVCLTIYNNSNCSFTFCKTINILNTGIAAVSGLGTIQVYPNPVSNQLTVGSRQLANEAIEITDLLGRALLVQKATGTQTTIDVSNLPAGVYLVEVRSMDGIAVKKFVKE